MAECGPSHRLVCTAQPAFKEIYMRPVTYQYVVTYEQCQQHHTYRTQKSLKLSSVLKQVQVCVNIARLKIAKHRNVVPESQSSTSSAMACTMTSHLL